MALSLQITCLYKSDLTNPYERITHIGGSGWKEAERDAIDCIQMGTTTYYVLLDGVKVDVIIAVNSGRKYLKTRNDGITPDHLLRLPQCL